MSYCDGEGRHSRGLVAVQGDILFHTGVMTEEITYIRGSGPAEAEETLGCMCITKVAADGCLDGLGVRMKENFDDRLINPNEDLPFCILMGICCRSTK